MGGFKACRACGDQIFAEEGDYCSAFCHEVDMTARLAAAPLPLPPAVPVGVFGALTDRPTGEDTAEYFQPVLPTGSDERKEIPIFSGVMNYFPLALAAVARHSKRGNDKHNPGQPLHWSRAKSADHADCIARHLIDVETVHDTTGEYEEAQALAWRALAMLQILEEKRLGRGPSRGSR